MAKLIIIEGLDGSGKSTQTSLIEEAFVQNKVSYRKIKLPDYESPSSTLVKMYLGGDFGKNAQDVNAYAAGAFYAVDRYASFKLDWKSDYETKDVILADRYATSNFIYQMEKLNEEEWDYYLSWSANFEYEKIGIPKPNLVLFLDMPIEVSQRLMSKRYNGDEEKKDVHERDIAFLHRCRKAALYAAEKQGWEIINCALDNSPREQKEIHKEIMKIIKEDLKIASF